MSELTVPKRTLWQVLLGPHPDLKDAVAQQHARALAGISLVLVIASGATLAYILLAVKEPRGVYGLPFLVVFVVAYGLSRTRLAAWGSGILVFGTAALDVFLLAITHDVSVVSGVTTFILLPILFSTVLLDARLTLILCLAINAGLGIYFATARWLDFSNVVVPFMATLLISILGAATAYMRERDLETIRHQQAALDRHSHSLEAEIDQHTRNILATAEIGRVVAGARDLDTMLKQIVALITERFNYYYAQVFLVDEAAKQAVLRAGTGSAGEELLARGHRVQVGSQSVVGRVTATGNSIVVMDTDTDPIHRRNELLPHTRSEVGLPLRVSGRVIGALNIQSTSPAAFQDADVTVFQTIADQLGIAIENARLFEQAQRDLQDIETLNRQLTGEAWHKYLSGRSNTLPSGFTSNQEGVAPVGALQAGEGEAAPSTLSLPLRVRGETIGVLDVTSRSGQNPDEQMKSMLEAVAERVALALDSTRVGEQAQRQAEREQVLSAISAELQANTDLNVILRIVTKEASRAMGAAHSFIHLAMSYDEGPTPRQPQGEKG